MFLLNDLGAHNQHCHFLQNDIPRKLLPLASSKSCEATDKQGLEESSNSLTAEHCPVISEVSLSHAALWRRSPMRWPPEGNASLSRDARIWTGRTVCPAPGEVRGPH